jgi:hypothetical protein
LRRFGKTGAGWCAAPCKAARRLTQAACVMTPAAKASSTGSAAAGMGNALATAAPMRVLTLIAVSQPATRRGWAPSSAPVARPSPNACTASATATATEPAKRNSRALQEAVYRQRRCRARAAGMLGVFPAAAAGAGCQARGGERVKCGAEATRCAGHDGHAAVKRPGQFTQPCPGRRGMVPLALCHRPQLPACLVLADQSAGCPFGHRPKRRLARWRAPTKLCVTPSPWAMASDRITADKHF